MIDTIALILVLLGIALVFLGLVSREEGSARYEKYERYEDYGYKGYGYGRMREKEPDTEGEREPWERSRGRKVKGAGIIMIGPIPIIFGDSRYAFYLGIIAIVLMLLSILLMFSFAGY